jgi:hypothetical protein
MARPDGVVIVSERHWAFAGRDGTLREGTMPTLPGWVHRVPLARGLARLGLSLAPLFRRSGVAGRRERPFLLAALLAPFLLFLLPGSSRTPLGPARSPRSRSGGSLQPGKARRDRRASRRAAVRTSLPSRYR